MNTNNEFTIYFTNDIHSYIPKSLALFGRLATLHKATNKIIVDLGDFSEGHAFYNLLKGKPESELITKLYDFIIPGNHGFQDVISLYKNGFPIINSNLLYNDQPFFEKYLLYRHINIAFIGILSPEAFSSIEIKKRKGFTVQDPIEILPDLIRQLRETANKIILLSHSGFIYDIELAKNIPAIDVIISSHCHSKLSQKRVGNTLIVKAPEYARGYGALKLNNDAFSYRITSVENSIKPEFPEIKFLEKYITKYDQTFKKKIFILQSKFVKRCKNRKQLTHYFLKPLINEFNVDLAVINYHCFRALLPNEAITLEDIYNCCPLENELFIAQAQRNEFEKVLNSLPDSLKRYLCLNTPLKRMPKIIKFVTTSYLAGNIFADFKENCYNTGIKMRDFITQQLMREAKHKNDINWIKDRRGSKKEKDRN